jgi:protein-disulfide isomerase
MNHKFWIVMIIGVLVLGACSSPATVSPTPVPPTETPKPVATPTTESAVAPSEEPAVEAPDCKPFNILETDPNIPPVTDKEWIKGPLMAKTTLIVYSDFQCPYCAMISPVLTQLLKEHPDDIRMVYRHFPLIDIHDKAALAAQAAEAAGLQGKFWEFHDLLLDKQNDWSGMPPEQFKTWLQEKATELKLDTKKFTEDTNSEPIKNIVAKAYQDAAKTSIGGTPTLIFNGVYYNLEMGGDVKALSDFITLLDKLTELQKRQFTTCPDMTIDASKKYEATIKTDKGDIVIDLYADKAPLTVNSFIFLARNGWYKGATFHRVIAGFVAQSGDPSGTGAGGPGYVVKDEIAPSLKFDGAG